MANKTFAQLPAITSTNSADKVPIWDETGGVAAHITIANLAPDILDASGVDISGHIADGTLHRTINDAGSGATDLWSANKIAAYVAASTPTGVIKADGSVAMAANLDFADNGIDSDDDDITFQLGRIYLGQAGASDSATFAHIDHANGSDFAFRQNSTGVTIFNSATGQPLNFRTSGTNRAVLSDSNLNLLDTPVTSNDGDTAYTLGRITLGYDGTNSDRAIFAHRDMATSASFAVGQDADGASRFNTASGKPMRFSIGGTEKVTMDLNGRWGINEAGPETSLHVTGASAGAVGTPGDTYAIFENSGNCAIQIRTGTTHDGAIHFGSTTGNSMGEIRYSQTTDFMTFRVNNGAVLDIRSTALTPTFDNAYDLGSASFRYDDIYATNGTIQTSDGRLKKAIKPSALGLDFINALRPVSYKRRSSPERKAKKDGRPDRTHYGLIAQEVKTVLDQCGIDTVDFAGYVEGDGVLGLRYEEFISPLIRAFQEQDMKVEELKKQVEGLLHAN